MTDRRTEMRNPFCGHYAACLDRAARINGPLDCAGCRYEKDVSGPGPDEAELRGCLSLLNVLSQPEKQFQQYLITFIKNKARTEAEI